MTSSNHSAAHTALVGDILLALGSRSYCRVWKANTGAARTKAGRLIRFGIIGQADISGILVDGRRLEIEVKTGSGRPSERQSDFGKVITRFGGVHVVARSVDDAINAVEHALEHLRTTPEPPPATTGHNSLTRGPPLAR